MQFSDVFVSDSYISNINKNYFCTELTFSKFSSFSQIVGKIKHEVELIETKWCTYACVVRMVNFNLINYRS